MYEQGIRIIIALLAFGANFNICETISIQCKFMVTPPSTHEDIYLCFGTLVTGGSIENVTSISGSHQSGKSNLDVLGFRMTSQNLQFFREILKHFFQT